MTDYEGRRPEPGDLWQYVAIGYCEWVNGEWPDDDDLIEAKAAAKHIESYVRDWLHEETCS